MLIYLLLALLNRGRQDSRTLTQTRPIIHIWVGEMKVPVKLSVIEFHSHGVMRFLIDGPDSTGQIQTEISPAASPRCTTGLDWRMDLGLGK